MAKRLLRLSKGISESNRSVAKPFQCGQPDLKRVSMAKTTWYQRWLSLAQAGHYSGLTDRTLRNYESAGLLEFHRIIQPGATRGTVRIDRLKLDALIEESVAPASKLKMNKGKGAI